MKFTFNRRFALVVTLCVAVATVLAIPVFALAITAPGTTPENPIALSALPWASPVSGTLSLYEWDPDFSDYDTFYTVPLSKGQIVSFTASSTIGAPRIEIEWESAAAQGPVLSSQVGTNTAVSTLVVPANGLYDVTVYNPSAALPFSLMAATSTVAPRYSLGGTKFTGTPKKNKTFYAYVDITPLYDTFTVPVKFNLLKWNGKKYKAVKSYTAFYAGGVSNSTEYAKDFKLGAGKYEINATFADSLNKAKSNAYKKFTIK